MDKVSFKDAKKRLHLIESIVNLGKGFFELMDRVLLLNVVKRILNVENLNADCV